jgi:RimJ/RimL family protein N-acetyltransferase
LFRKDRLGPASGVASGILGAVPDVELETERLILRAWRDEDLAPFARMNADPRVMEFFPQTYDEAESAEGLARIRAHFAAHAFGLWAVEVKGGPAFVGMVGLAVPSFQARFTPCVEVGWRLLPEHWRQGYATEGARGALAFGFGTLGLREIVSFTTVNNWPSRRVMERLGMSHTPDDDFLHPSLPDGHPLRPHVLYRLTNAGFSNQ